MALAQHEEFHIKHVPQNRSVRAAIRAAAKSAAEGLDLSRPPDWQDLQKCGKSALAKVGLGDEFLGFAMVAVNNAFWFPAFAATPHSRRLLLLPHCLSDRSTCTGDYDSIGLNCNQCGACNIGYFKSNAEELGYTVVVAEGTTSVIMQVLEGHADAILGVACLDSLEKSYTRIAELGIPNIAIPLIKDGCVNTEAEVEEIESALTSISSEALQNRTRSYLPLLRETASIFNDVFLADLQPTPEAANLPTSTAQAIAMDWLQSGGKRLRPFITLTSYTVARHGTAVLEPDADVPALISAPIKRIALAIEAMHKASLVHDDIEDNDSFRYGHQTVHIQYGLAPALNVGDYLVGMGYRLISAAIPDFGADCIADIISRLSSAHLDLCRGQGAELAWGSRDLANLRPIDALSIYALKTAPAFEVAIYAGLRPANAQMNDSVLRRFCSYIGEAYQISNDLEDWDTTGENALPGKDAIARRPTILLALAIEAGQREMLSLLNNPNTSTDEIFGLYERFEVFAKANALLERLHSRAYEISDQISSPELRELLRFLAKVIIPHTTE